MIPSTTSSTFKMMPDALTSMILNYSSAVETAKNVHLVARSWQNLWRNDGHLDVSNSKITFDKLAQIVEKYNHKGKLTSLNLFNCPNMTIEPVEHLIGFPFKTSHLTECEKIKDVNLKHLTELILTDKISLCFTGITDEDDVI